MFGTDYLWFAINVFTVVDFYVNLIYWQLVPQHNFFCIAKNNSYEVSLFSTSCWTYFILNYIILNVILSFIHTDMFILHITTYDIVAIKNGIFVRQGFSL